jgi:hypothetical protein
MVDNGTFGLASSWLHRVVCYSDSPNVWHEPRKLRRMQMSLRASCKYRNHVIRCVCVGEERDGLGRNAAAAVRATQPGLLSPGKGH